MLLEIREIQRLLDEEFIPLEPMLTGFRLIEIVNGDALVDEIQKRLEIRLDQSLADLISRFDFGSFTIGPIAFCGTGNYVKWLIDRNADDDSQEYPWWGAGRRPKMLLLIASSDGYRILIECSSGNVLAFRNGEPWDHALVVSKNFTAFFRGIGTVFIKRNPEGDNEKLASEVAVSVEGTKGIDFWEWMAE